jgi:putative endonuclease
MGKSEVGQIGEETAAKYLKKMGYKILDRNWKNPFGYRLGEIDIIAREKKEIIFVEVKTRAADNCNQLNVLPEEQINRSKLHKLERIASCYLNVKRLKSFPYRFDAVSVWLDSDYKQAKIKHIKSIFI